MTPAPGDFSRALLPLAAPPPGPGWNHADIRDLLPDGGATLRDAAVLVGLVDRGEGAQVVLTRRTEGLRHHGGQISFPGGRIEAADADPVAAALREAQEEISLDPAQVQVLGAADPYRTVTNYLVTPVIGLVPPDLPLHGNEHEVADWFEAPLDFLVDPANQQRRSAVYQGRERHYYEIEWNGRRIWGATAAMIVNLSRRMAG